MNSIAGFFLRFSSGHFRRHRLEAFLCLVGVALGVAVVVAIDSAVAACVSSFRGAVQTLAERSTHSVFAEGGRISDETYIALARRKLPYPMAPVIDRGVLVKAVPRKEPPPRPSPGVPGEGEIHAVVARLMGVDVFSERSLRSYTQVQSSLDANTSARFLTEPGQVVLVEALANRIGVKRGEDIELTVGDRRVTAYVLDIAKPTGVGASQLSDVILADLATAQELTGSVGFIDRIDAKLDSEKEARELSAALPPGLVLRSTSQRSSSLTELIGAYKLNLNALSLMASFVAVFIVYNSMLISVQQRTRSLGILRCLGASRSQLGGTYLVEAFLFAIVGGALGVIVGWLLSKTMVGFIATTINDLYAVVRPAPVTLDAAAFVKGLAISIASCLAGAAVPLFKASRTPPVNAFRLTARADTSRRATGRLLIGGVCLLAISYGLYLLPSASPVVGFAMALTIALGFALICPWMARVACIGVESIARPLQLLPLRMAASGVRRSLGITGVAIAATMLAMAMNVGIRTMVSSFRGSLGRWVEQRFSADVFIGPELLVNHKIDATIDPRVEQWVRTQPEIQKLITYRTRNTDFAGKSIMLTGTDVAELLATRALPLKHSAATAFDPAKDALISEPLAGRTKLSVGDSFQMQSPAGLKYFTVYAVFFDFGSERGQITLDHQTYAGGWKDDAVNSLHLRLKPGNDPAALATRWNAELRKDYPVVVSSFNAVKSEVMTVFDRTFKVTEVLTWLAAGVAFCGLAGSLLSISLARQRDYSVLAAIGMSGRQTAVWMLGQGILIAWVSALVAAVAGTILAYVLAYVIQYRSFGWSIPTEPSPRFWIEGLVLATVAALAAAVYPAYRLRAAPPAGSLRQE